LARDSTENFVSKEETKGNEIVKVEPILLAQPGWWDARGVVNAYGDVKGVEPYSEKVRVKAQTAYFAKHAAAKELTWLCGQVVHPEHIEVSIAMDVQPKPNGESKPNGKKVNGRKRK